MKVIVITGAGSGMGRSTAVLLSENTNNLIICIGRDQEKLNKTRNLMHSHQPHQYWAMDIRHSKEWKKHVDANYSILENLEVVFANAGIGGSNHFGENDRWEDILSTNLTGTYLTIQHLLPFLKNNLQSEYKHIVITSSCLARFGVPAYSAYCTSKTGLLGLTRSLAVELSSDKILVNALCPGWVETEMAIAGVGLLSEISGKTLGEEIENQKSLVPLNRFSDPQEIAKTVRFLISNEQVSITGQAIDINNGSIML
jgi:NAD(P)-dependent dehydrogenase (short-subunit alcohol dehydrogenase family)